MGLTSDSRKRKSRRATLFRRKAMVQRKNPTFLAPRPHPIERFSSSRRYAGGSMTKTLDYDFTTAQVFPFVQDTQPQTIININSTGVIQLINLIQQGAGISQRIGNKVTLKSLRMRLSLQSNNSYTNGGVNSFPMTNSRLMIVYDRQPNMGYPQVNAILGQLSQSNTVIAGTMWDSINPNELERYTVLYDKFRVLPPNTVSLDENQATTNGPSTQSDTFQHDIYIKLRDVTSMYVANSNPALIGNVMTGALYLISFGDQTAGATTEPWGWKGSCRLRFNDG